MLVIEKLTFIGDIVFSIILSFPDSFRCPVRLLLYTDDVID